MSEDLASDAPTVSEPAAADYDAIAEGYAAGTESNLINGYYTRPAIIELAGDVAGRRILDVGCGAGPILDVLRSRGANVTGIDPSGKILDIARARLGDDVDLRVASLGEVLPFADSSFDDAIACLVLHYLEDWTGPLAELRRVLVPGGRLIVAVDHPFIYKFMNPDADYFAVSSHAEEMSVGGQSTMLTFWHRPLHAMTDAFTDAGFRISVVSEPGPAPEAYSLFPDELSKFASGKFLCFLFFVLEAI